MLLVYSKPFCPQCNQLEHDLTSSNLAFETKKLGTDFDRNDLVELFEKLELPLPRSFPLLFKDDKYVGSLAEAKALISSGEL